MTPDRCPACRRPWGATRGERQWRTLTTIRKIDLAPIDEPKPWLVEATYPNTTLQVCGDCAAALPKRDVTRPV